MSRWLHWLNNRKQNFCLLYSIQRTAMERLDSITRRLRKESNKSNKHEQSGKSSESVEPTTSTATASTRTFGRSSTRATATGSTASSRSSTTGNTKGRSTKGRHTKSGSTATANRECANDILNREYAEYLASTSAGREDASTGIRVSDEPRNFKPTNADSTDPIERSIGIPAGVTV